MIKFNAHLVELNNKKGFIKQELNPYIIST